MLLVDSCDFWFFWMSFLCILILLALPAMDESVPSCVLPLVYSLGLFALALEATGFYIYIPENSSKSAPTSLFYRYDAPRHSQISSKELKRSIRSKKDIALTIRLFNTVYK